MTLGRTPFAMIGNMPPVPPRVTEPPARPTSSALGHALILAGDKWNLQIIRAVFDGAERFAHLRDELGISDAVLSHRLSRLTGDGILYAHRYSIAPPRNEYRLTDLGNDLWPTLVALWSWDRHWAPRPPGHLRHLACGHLVSPVFGCAGCAAIGVTARDVRTEVDAPLLVDVTDRRSRRTVKDDAPETDSTSVLADRWSTFLLAAALEGNRRFGDFQARLGSISPVTLTDRLARFVDNGMLVRTPITDGARRQEYRTTPKSLDFFPVFATLNVWAALHLSADGRSGLTVVHRPGNHLLEPQYTCNACNAVLHRDDTEFTMSSAERPGTGSPSPS